MRLLVAREFEPGRYQRVTVQRCDANGRNFSPGLGSKKLCGSVAGMLCKEAAQFFSGEPAARTVVYGDQKIRVDRID